MFKPDPKSSKKLTTYQTGEKAKTRSLEAVRALYENAPGRVKIRWNERMGIPKTVRGILTEPMEGTDEEIARKFLVDNQNLFGFQEDTSDLQYVQTTERRGIRHVKYRQVYKGLSVFGAEVTVHIDQANRVQMVNGEYCPDIEIDITSSPIPKKTAIENVLADFGAEVQLRQELQVELVVFPQGGRFLRAYKVMLKANKPLGDWVYFVDAATGTILDSYNAMYFLKGKGKIYNSNPERDTDIATAELFDLHGDGTLSGSYFRIENDAGPEAYSATHEFLYEPSDPHFDEVMVYYHLNKVAEFFRNLGHTNHPDTMPVHVHVANPYTTDPDYDNAFFSPFDNAIYFGHGRAFNDLAKDADVIYHEYTHAIVHTAQSFMATNEASALHEGYADYFSSSISDDPKVGEYVVKKLGEKYLRNLRNQKTYQEYTGVDEHTDGEIWGITCWKMREALGQRVVDLLLYEGLWFLPQNATFVDAYEGIVQADTNIFSSEHLDEIDEIFREQKIIVVPVETHPITAIANIGGSILPSGEVTVKHGESQTFTMTADSDYYIKHVVVDGISVGSVNSYTFDQVTSSHTIEAFFKKEEIETYIITASANPGGSISPSGTVVVKRGENKTFTITPSSGNSIKIVLVDGLSVGAVNSYTFKNVTAAHTIEALFRQGEIVERTVIVPGDTQWLDTGITISSGNFITITARGTVIYDRKGNSCGPGGTSWTDTRDQKDPLWQHSHAGLIGKIGGTGIPFFIGTSYTGKAGTSGKLFLGINDYWYQGNSGEFTVMVRVSSGTS